ELLLYRQWLLDHRLASGGSFLPFNTPGEAQLEKTQSPQLLSREDLKIRWQMNSRQSVHQVASKPDFPQPVFAFNHGKN
ncbi:hypothetical protein L3X07_14765, partial [Levilactobacillus brevis]|nr:hypothetical protein [Levilactobacillus brevis]